MNKKVPLIYFTLLMITFLGCNNDDSDTLNLEPSCSISENYHFTGYINDISKLFLDGSQTYQRYVGAEVDGIEEPKGRFIFGINTWPENIGDESIYIYSPKVNTKDASNVSSKFPLGELNLKQREEFKLYYDVLIDTNDHRTERLEGKFDENSSMEICKFESIPNSGTNTQFKVSLIFNCRLYRLDGELKGEIKDGNMTGLIQVYDKE